MSCIELYKKSAAALYFSKLKAVTSSSSLIKNKYFKGLFSSSYYTILTKLYIIGVFGVLEMCTCYISNSYSAKQIKQVRTFTILTCGSSASVFQCTNMRVKLSSVSQHTTVSVQTTGEN